MRHTANVNTAERTAHRHPWGLEIAHLDAVAVLTLSLLDTLLERLGLVHLRGSQAVTVSGRASVVRVAHTVSDRTLVRGSGALQLVATAVGVGAAELLVVTTKRREAGSLERLASVVHGPS